MEEVKVAPAAYAAPATAPVHNGQYIQKTPGWVVIVRGLQIFFGLIIICLCGYLIHGKAMDANIFALVVCLMTWVVAAYSLFSEKIPGLNGLYNIWAVLALDLLMAIFWLSSMGANAAQRAAFKYSVDIEYCYNDGSTVNSNYCVVSKRDLEKRAAVAGPVGLAIMSAIAGLSALVMLFFIATLVFHGHHFRLHHQSKKPASDNATVEMNPQQAPAPGQGTYAQYPPQAQPQGYPVQTEHTPQQMQPQVYQQQAQQFSPQSQPSPYVQAYPQQYPQTVPSPAPVSTPSPASHELAQPVPTTSPAPYELPHGHHQQQPGPYQLPGSQPQPYAAYPDPSQAQYQHQQQQQHPYSPQGTPAPGQPYYPPQQ